jgi:RNA polymerase sigma-70 factor (ECF subfamily)
MVSSIQPAVDLVARLFRARGDDLLGFLRRRLNSDADAHDIAQEAYLRFIRLAEPERIDNAEAYLFRIAANLLWEHRMREKRMTTDLDTALEIETEHTPLDLAVSSQQVQRFRQALDALPATPRAVLVLSLRDGLSYEVIGSQLGVSVSMVKKHMQAALAFCRRRLRDMEP